MKRIELEENMVGKRIDALLTKLLQNNESFLEFHERLSRSFIQKNMLKFVSINGRAVKASYKLKKDDELALDEDLALDFLSAWKEERSQIDNIVPQEGRLDIIEETDDYLVINKEKGVSVHPGNNIDSGTLANYVKGYLEGKGVYDPLVNRAGIVHRLDKPVSGLIIVAKNIKFQNFIKKQFEDHEVFKVYKARVEDASLFEGVKSDATIPQLQNDWLKGTLSLSNWNSYEGFIGRDEVDRVKMRFAKISLNDSYKNAKTNICFVGNDEFLVNIETGRMHQIRATFSYLGIPIKGDTLYGKGRRIPSQIELQSSLIGFVDLENKKVCITL